MQKEYASKINDNTNYMRLVYVGTTISKLFFYDIDSVYPTTWSNKLYLSIDFIKELSIFCYIYQESTINRDDEERHNNVMYTYI